MRYNYAFITIKNVMLSIKPKSVHYRFTNIHKMVLTKNRNGIMPIMQKEKNH